jgi:predicted ester cyclase
MTTTADLILEYLALTDSQSWPEREALVTDDAVFRTPRGEVVGPAAMTGFSRGMVEGIAAAAHVVDTIVDGEGRAAIEGTWTATEPTSGSALRLPFTAFASSEGERLTSIRVMFDPSALAPPPAPTDGGDLVRRIFERGINERDPEALRALVGDGYVNHDLPAPAPGPDGLTAVLDQFFAAFPDMHVTVEDVIEDGDRIATRGRFVGTHRGEFNGVAATGRPVDVKYIDVWRVEDGKAVENWVQMDLLGLLQQVGAVPAPSA